jgi:hypothetical protein
MDQFEFKFWIFGDFLWKELNFGLCFSIFFKKELNFCPIFELLFDGNLLRKLAGVRNSVKN